MSNQTANATDLKLKILKLVKKNLPERKIIDIKDIKPINNGWETQIISFQLQYQSSNEVYPVIEDLILRIYQEISDDTKAITESNIMLFLNSVGYRVPRVLFRDLNKSIFDRPLIVMKKINGCTLGEILFSLNSDKEKILTRFCQLLLDLHKIDWHTYIENTLSKNFQDAYYFTDTILNYLKTTIKQYNLKELFPYYQWIEQLRNKVPCTEYSLIHLDYHPYNIIVDKNDQYFVIDWSNGRIGDYRADLAWTLILTLYDSTYTYYQTIFNIYKTLRKKEIEQFTFFEIAMALRRLSDLIVSIKYGANNRDMQPEAVESMKKSLDHYNRIYRLLVNRTNISVFELENIVTGKT